MQLSITKFILYLISFFGFGLLVGKYTNSPKPSSIETVYVKGERVTDTIIITDSVLIREYLPSRQVLLYVTDTLNVVDTVRSYRATIEDWNTERMYSQTVFKSDTLGELSYTASVQYNRLKKFAYSYDPVVRIDRQVLTKDKYRPYVGMDYNSFNQATLSVGLLKGRIGINANLVRDFDSSKFAVGTGLKIVF